VVELPHVPEDLAPYRPQLTQLARPCLALQPVRAESALPVGASKVGGAPDLPAGVAWPRNDDGVPVPFAFQVNLTELARLHPGLLPLPEEPGLLQFFTTFVDEDTWAVGKQWRDGWYEPARGDNRVLVHHTVDGPVDGPEPFQEEWRLVAEPAVSLPGYLELSDRAPELFAVLRADQRLRDSYRDWLAYDLGLYNLVGGFPSWVQDAAYYEAVGRERGLRFHDVAPSPLGELQAEGRNWHLVCQLDSIIGDDGRMYLLAPMDSAGRYELDRTQYVYQCT